MLRRAINTKTEEIIAYTARAAGTSWEKATLPGLDIPTRLKGSKVLANALGPSELEYMAYFDPAHIAKMQEIIEFAQVLSDTEPMDITEDEWDELDFLLSSLDKYRGDALDNLENPDQDI